jgi:hypothetical protein
MSQWTGMMMMMLHPTCFDFIQSITLRDFTFVFFLNRRKRQTSNEERISHKISITDLNVRTIASKIGHGIPQWICNGCVHRRRPCQCRHVPRSFSDTKDVPQGPNPGLFSNKEQADTNRFDDANKSIVFILFQVVLLWPND